MESLSIEVFGKLIYAKIYKPSIEVMEKALGYYNTIIDCPPERLMDKIVSVRQIVAHNHSSSIGNVAPTLYCSNIIWEYVYTFAYYLNHDSAIWKTHLLPRMKTLMRHPGVKEDIAKVHTYVDEYIQRRKEFMADLANYEALPTGTQELEQLQQQIAELKQQLADKDAEIAAKDARIAEYDALLAHPHLSFIETEGKSPQKIQWAYQDIARFVKKPATMAVCLIDLQTNGMLKGQERYGDLENIKAIHDELKEKYGIKWTYAALCKAINKAKAKKQIH